MKAGSVKVLVMKFGVLSVLRVLEPDALRGSLEVPLAVEAGEHDCLIEDPPSGPVHRMGITPLGSQIRFATGHKGTAGLVNPVDPLEVKESPVHDVEGTMFRHQLSKDVHLVHFAVGHLDGCRDISTQIEHVVQLDRRFDTPKRYPWRNRQTQIDGCGVRTHGGNPVLIDRYTSRSHVPWSARTRDASSNRDQGGMLFSLFRSTIYSLAMHRRWDTTIRGSKITTGCVIDQRIQYLACRKAQRSRLSSAYTPN